VFAFGVRGAKAQFEDPIVINPNGTISSPVAANITNSGNVTYTFTGNNYLPIIVNRSNIIIDGNGHALQALGNYGFSLTSMSNVTIKNTTITNSLLGIALDASSGNVLSDNNITHSRYYGIGLYSSDNSTVSGNDVTLNVDGGISLDASSGNVLSDNNVTSNDNDGIYLYSSSGNVLSDNNVIQNQYGIELDFSSGNVLSGNVMANNTEGFGFFGFALSDFVNYVHTSNLVDGKPVCYLMNQSSVVISPQSYPGGVGYVGLVNCKNVTVQSLILTQNLQGLLLANTTDSKINDNNITSNGNGIYLYCSSDNNTVSGNNVTANIDNGIWLYSSSNNTLSKNTIKADSIGGIYLESSDNNTLSSNNITANGGNGGIAFESSDRNTVSNNVVSANNIGIELYYSSSNVLSGNMIANDTYYNFGMYGVSLAYFMNNVDTSNLVNGKPVYYLMNESNVMMSPKTSPEGVGYVGFVNCENVTVEGLTLTKNVQGLLLANTTDSRITDNNITANYDGVDLYNSSSDVLSGNNVTANTYYGINLESLSDNNTLTGNNIIANSEAGISFYFSSGNVLSGNNITRNNDGIDLVSSSGNVLSGNNVTANTDIGIDLNSSFGNKIFHNNFLNNGLQATPINSSNTWDDGYPSGGNYWSDYRTRYPSASENDSSGIWNTSYVIDSNNTDRYPLMGPFQTFGVGTWNAVAYSVDTVSNSTITDVSFNSTAKTLSFDVTGTSGTPGFCRVDIPTGLMSGRWTLIVGGIHYSNQTIVQSGNYTYIYFTYTQDPKTVQIQSANAVSELQPFMLLPVFMIITLFAAMIIKRKRSPKTQVAAVVAKERKPHPRASSS